MTIVASMFVRVIIGLIVLLVTAVIAALGGAGALWLILEVGERVMDAIMHDGDDDDVR